MIRKKTHAPELLAILAAAEKLSTVYTTNGPASHLMGDVEATAVPFAGTSSDRVIKAMWLDLVEALHDARIAGIKVDGGAA